MKTIIIILIVLGVGYFLFFDSEKVDAAFSVFKNKSEMAIVESAGKGDVVLEMAEKRIDNLRKRVIAIKAAKRSMARKINTQGLSQESLERYKQVHAALGKSEKKGEDALLKSREKFEELRAKVEMMETEIAAAKSTSQIMNELNPKYRRDELKKIMESLEEDLDKANSELDVAILEAQ